MVKRTWKYALGLAAIAFALGCHRAPQLQGPEPFLQVAISPEQGWPLPLDPPCRLDFHGASNPAPEPYWQVAGEMECDFPGGATLRQPCFSLVGFLADDVSMEPIQRVPAARDFSSMTLFTGKGKTRPVGDFWRFGYSGPTDPVNKPPLGNGRFGIYYAIFKTKLIPVRYRIFESGKLVCRGDIRLVEPPKAP